MSQGKKTFIWPGAKHLTSTLAMDIFKESIQAFSTLIPIDTAVTVWSTSTF